MEITFKRGTQWVKMDTFTMSRYGGPIFEGLQDAGTGLTLSHFDDPLATAENCHRVSEQQNLKN